jgi:isoleucyl-tRNA synthetase
MCTVTHIVGEQTSLFYTILGFLVYKISEVKDRMFDLNETINWKPKATGEGRFGTG